MSYVKKTGAGNTGQLAKWYTFRMRGVFIVSCALLIVTAIGEFSRGDGLDELYAKAETAEGMPDLFGIVVDRFDHGQARYTFAENWVVYLAGLVRPEVNAIRDPDQLLRRRDAALCSQQSYILVLLANHAGIRARHVGLNGHVVMEAWDDGWKMYDPDYEVSANKGVAELYASELQALYPERVVQMYLTTDDNQFAEYPAHFNSADLMLFESVTHWLKWIIPIGLIVLTRRRP